MFYVIPDTLLKVSINTNKAGQLVIAYNMVTSFIGVECHFQQNVSYSVEHGDQFYWCLTTLSTTDMLLKAGLFLKVVLNTNKNVHHIIHYN
jgi:hypothetical protein